jgi:4-hydroxybenzoate polyprenyltransferase
MFNFIYQVLRTARPRQWLKNLSLFAAPIFAGTLFNTNVIENTFRGFIIFCIVSSGVYFMNDIIDVEKDRQHPVKKNRPIASGKLSRTIAIIIALGLFTSGIFLAERFVGTFFTYAILFYIAMQVAYSLHFRNVIILDSLFVGTGFIIRVFAGGFAAESSISSWLILTTIGLSLLLAFGKRRSERTILLKHLGDDKKMDTRKTLRHYPDNLLDSMISMSASFCIITYAIFTFQTSSQVFSGPLVDILPSILRGPKWMMLTIPIVIYGVARYLYVIYEKKEGESPERVLLSDWPLLSTVILWGTAILIVIYFLPALS